MAQVVQHLVPEAGVQQVQHRVLGAADVQVDAAAVALPLRAHPVALVLGVDERLVVGGIEVAQLVPARPRPLRHRVGLAAVGLGALAQVERDLDPVGGPGQRRHRLGRLVVVGEGGGGVVLDVGQHDRQHRLGQRPGQAVVGVVDDGERLAPEPLAAEQPVAQLGGDGALAGARGLQPVDDPALGVGDAQAVQADLVVGAVDGRALADVRLALPALGRLDRAHDGQVEDLGERPVALVLAGHGHDRPGAVAHQHVVGDEHGDRAPRWWGWWRSEPTNTPVFSRASTWRSTSDAGAGLAPVGGDGLGGAGVPAGPRGPGRLGDVVGPGGRGQLRRPAGCSGASTM